MNDLTHVSNFLDLLPMPIDAADCGSAQCISDRVCGLVKVVAVEVAELRENISRHDLDGVHARLVRLTASEWGLDAAKAGYPDAATYGTKTANAYSKRAQGFEVGELHLFLQPMKAISDLRAPLTKSSVGNNQKYADEWQARGLFEDVHLGHLALALALGEFGPDQVPVIGAQVLKQCLRVFVMPTARK